MRRPPPDSEIVDFVLLLLQGMFLFSGSRRKALRKSNGEIPKLPNPTEPSVYQASYDGPLSFPFTLNLHPSSLLSFSSHPHAISPLSTKVVKGPSRFGYRQMIPNMPVAFPHPPDRLRLLCFRCIISSGTCSVDMVDERPDEKGVKELEKKVLNKTAQTAVPSSKNPTSTRPTKDEIINSKRQKDHQ